MDLFGGDGHHPNICLLHKSRILKENERRGNKKRRIKIGAVIENRVLDLDRC